MTSSPAFSKLALIFMINLFAQMQTTNAGKISSFNSAGVVKNKVKNALSPVCSNVYSASDLHCNHTIDFFDTKIKEEVRLITIQFCHLTLWKILGQYPSFNKEMKLFHLFISKQLQPFERNCRISTGKSIRPLIDRVREPLKKKCATELEEFSPEDMNGKRPRLCIGIPTTAEKVCSTIVAEGCQVLRAERSLDILIPDCEEHLSKIVCGDLLSAIKEVVEEIMNPIEETTTPKITTTTQYRSILPYII